MIKLHSGHIQISHEIIEKVFGNEEQANMVFYPERKDLLLAARSKTFFEKLHKTQWIALKLKNMKGDKTIFVRNLLLDYDLDDTDRPLDFEIKTTGILEIKL